MRQWDKMEVNIKDIKRRQDTARHPFKEEANKVGLLDSVILHLGRRINQKQSFCIDDLINSSFNVSGYQPQQMQY